jgi:hypothetical protein
VVSPVFCHKREQKKRYNKRNWGSGSAAVAVAAETDVLEHLMFVMADSAAKRSGERDRDRNIRADSTARLLSG